MPSDAAVRPLDLATLPPLLLPQLYMSASLRRGTMFMLCSSWKSSLQA